MKLSVSLFLSALLHFVVVSDFGEPFLPEESIAVTEVSVMEQKRPQPSRPARTQRVGATGVTSSNGHVDQSWPELIHQPAISYPEKWKRQKIEGIVRAKLAVSSFGEVENVEILESVSEELDKVAENAMRRFRFRPATAAGKPVASEIEYVYRFVLR